MPPNCRNPGLSPFLNDYPPASDKWLWQIDGQNCPTSNRYEVNLGGRSFTRNEQQTHKKRREKRLSAREKIVLKRVFLRSKMISTSSAYMMSDRPDTIQTIDIMSGPNYRTDRTHPFRSVLVSGAGWWVIAIQDYILARTCGLIIRWQIFIFTREKNLCLKRHPPCLSVYTCCRS